MRTTQAACRFCRTLHIVVRMSVPTYFPTFNFLQGSYFSLMAPASCSQAAATAPDICQTIHLAGESQVHSSCKIALCFGQRNIFGLRVQHQHIFLYIYIYIYLFLSIIILYVHICRKTVFLLENSTGKIPESQRVRPFKHGIFVFIRMC